MNPYEHNVRFEVQQWKKKLLKQPSILNRLSKKAQSKVNEFIPDKVHQVITASIKKLVEATLFGSEYTTRKRDVTDLTLEERENLILSTLNKYRKTAAAEGAGTGAGGFVLGLADFPLLLSIKMKFLFETASLYGFDVSQYEERLFILHVFQLAFSSDTNRRYTLEIIEHWEERKRELHDLDWHVFQQEYRDYIDFVKMLQLVPGIGAVVGAYANYNLLEHLGDVAMNAYRIRILDGISQ